ncbi:MAG: hypothetical protein H6707_16365 [Deltaproteobacteria bacterium]|nr:hypothetical protein [Deltaproteobacteria bacterium]
MDAKSSNVFGRIFHNLPLKLVSLALAVLLFVLVRSEKSSIAHGMVPISVLSAEDKILVSTPPRVVYVSVRGPASMVQRFRFEDIPQVTIDLGRVQPGFYRFRDNMVSLPAGLSVTELRPAGFVVRYAEKAERRLPIKPTLQGITATGYRVSSANANPREVGVVGPRAQLDGLDAIRTTPIDVDGAKKSFVVRVKLSQLPARTVLTRPVSTVEVAVEVKPVGHSVRLSGVRVVVQSSGGRTLRAVPDRVDVVVAGPQVALGALTVDSVTASVIVPNRARLPLVLEPVVSGLPQNVTVRKVAPTSVSVQSARP